MTSPFGSVEMSRLPSPDGIHEVTVYSWSLGRRADVSLFAPQEAASSDPLPLVILLHGVYGSHWAWARSASAHLTAQTLTTAGRIRPMVLAMPSDGLIGIGSGYLTQPAADAERWIVDDVRDVARLRYPGAGEAGVAIAGLSMGGWGALRLAARRPGRFAAAAGMSPLTTQQHIAGYANPRHRADHLPPIDSPELLPLLIDRREDLPPLRITCGTQDALIGEVRALHEGLTRAGVSHEYEESPGAHEWPVWETELAHSLCFIDRHLDSVKVEDH